MTPKLIHFCWLSGDAYPNKIAKHIDSWKRIMPDSEFIKNEDGSLLDTRKLPWIFK